MRALAQVVAAGAITPVGLGSVETAFSHRAAAAAMREAPLVDPEGEPVTMCFVPVLDPSLAGVPRAAALGARALAEVIGKLGPQAASLRARVVVAADEALARKAQDGTIPAAALGAALRQATRATWPDLEIEVVPRGAAAPGYFLPGLAAALASGQIEVALAGGVHTDHDQERITELAEAGRLFTPDRLDSLIPGEAAAFVALMREDTARRLGLAARAVLGPAATAQERARPDNDEPAFQAQGLTAALRAALSEAGAPVGWIMTDLTFETFRHFELQAAMTRTQRHYCDPQQVEAPAQRLGHLGAAAMPLHLALASEAYPRGFAPHSLALSIGGSDGGERAVVVIGAPR